MSITLTNPIVVTQGASTLETDPASALMSIQIDFTLGAPVAIFTAKAGAVSGVSLVPGTILGGDPTTVSINMTNGAWAATTGQTGTLSGPALTTMLTTLKTFRNSGETFLTSNSIVPGTQVAW